MMNEEKCKLNEQKNAGNAFVFAALMALFVILKETMALLGRNSVTGVFDTSFYAMMFIYCGTFFKSDRCFGAFLKQQAKQILLPYVYTVIGATVIHFLIHFATFRWLPGAFSETFQILIGFVFGLPNDFVTGVITVYSCGSLWFLLSLFIAFLLLNAIILKVPEKWQTAVVVLLAAIGAFFFLVSACPFSLVQGLVATLFVYVGYKAQKKAETEKRHPWRLLLFTVLSALILVGASFVFKRADSFTQNWYNFGIVGVLANGVIGFALFCVLSKIKLKKTDHDAFAFFRVRPAFRIFCYLTVEYYALPWYLIIGKVKYGFIVTVLLKILIVLCSVIAVNIFGMLLERFKNDPKRAASKSRKQNPNEIKQDISQSAQEHQAKTAQPLSRKDRLKIFGNKFAIYILLLPLAVILFLQLQISSATDLNSVFHVSFINISILYIVLLFVYELFGRHKAALITFVSIVGAYSIAAKYTLMFHGSPLSVSEFRNFTTAMTVIGNYQFKLNKRVIFDVVALGVAICLILLIDRLNKRNNARNYKKSKLLRVLGSGVLFVVTVLYCFTGDLASITVSEKIAIDRDGYVCFFVDDLKHTLFPFDQPEGYDPQKILANEENWNDNISDTKPDIVLILNESFSDITTFADVALEQDPLYDIKHLENAVFGYSLSVWPGGGTNNSEYELLTSNSMALCKTGAPFNYLDMSKSSANIVSYLQQLGYETTALHCFSATNYSRDKAYAGLGFDHIYLGPEYFTKSRFGNRAWLDSDNYNDLLNLVGQNDLSKPQFTYLLTYQNHGGYAQNGPEQDLIRITGSRGNDEELSEYASSVSLSASAFCDFVEKYKNSGRDVIICMVGDHTISRIDSYTDAQAEHMEFVKRTVPYVIWSNLDIDFDKLITESTSMVDICPSVLYYAGLPLSPYYQKVLNLHQAIPSRLYFGLCRDKDGNYGTIHSLKNEAYIAAVNQYYFAEYNGLIRGTDYMADLFKPQP